MRHPQDDQGHTCAFCAMAVVWLILAILLPLSQLWALGLTLFAMVVTYIVVRSHAMK